MSSMLLCFEERGFLFSKLLSSSSLTLFITLGDLLVHRIHLKDGVDEVHVNDTLVEKTVRCDDEIERVHDIKETQRQNAHHSHRTISLQRVAGDVIHKLVKVLQNSGVLNNVAVNSSNYNQIHGVVFVSRRRCSGSPHIKNLIQVSHSICLQQSELIVVL